jgi:hypothetical protein
MAAVAVVLMGRLEILVDLAVEAAELPLAVPVAVDLQHLDRAMLVGQALLMDTHLAAAEVVLAL